MGKNDNPPSQPSFLELRAPSMPNTPTSQLQLHPELAPAGVLEWSCSRQSWSHAKQALISRFGCADEATSGERSDGEHSPTPSADAQTERLRSTRSVARKRSSSLKTTSDR